MQSTARTMLWERWSNRGAVAMKSRTFFPRNIGLRRNLLSWRQEMASHVFEPVFLDSITVKLFGVKQIRQGTRGTARSRLRVRSAFEKGSAPSGSAGVSVMRMHLVAG